MPALRMFLLFAAVLTLALAACDDDKSGQLEAGPVALSPLPTDVPASGADLAAVTGVWDGTMTPQDGGAAAPFCLELSGGESGVVEAAAYVSGERAGFVQGTYDAFGLLLLSGDNSVLEGRVQDDGTTLTGVWSAEGSGELALQKAGGVSC
jgi:hypothetical protein